MQCITRLQKYSCDSAILVEIFKIPDPRTENYLFIYDVTFLDRALGNWLIIRRINLWRFFVGYTSNRNKILLKQTTLRNLWLWNLIIYWDCAVFNGFKQETVFQWNKY